MIVTSLEHLHEQVALTASLQAAIDFLQQACTQGAQTLADGRVGIRGDQVYAVVQSYETTNGEPKFEAHCKYLDVQYVVEGEEVIGWAFIDRLVVDVPYDEAKDVCFGRVPRSETTLVRLSAGQCVVLYPTDAHAPKLAVTVPTPVNKIVVKVALQSCAGFALSHRKPRLPMPDQVTHDADLLPFDSQLNVLRDGRSVHPSSCDP